MGSVMSPRVELTAERVIVGAAGTILTAAVIWLGATVQQSSRETAEMRIEIRALVDRLSTEERRSTATVHDHEQRLRRLEQQVQSLIREEQRDSRSQRQGG